MERKHRGSAEPPSLSTCPRQLAQQTGPIVETQLHPGGACLRTYDDNAIDPLQCRDPGPFPSNTQQPMCGYTHNGHAELKQSNYISMAKHIIVLFSTNK